MPWFKSRRRIRREASEWVVRLAEAPDTDHQAAFELWYTAAPEHAAAFERMQDIWKLAAQMKPGAVPAQPRRAGLPQLALAASILAVAALAACLFAFGSGRLAPAAAGPELTFTSARSGITPARLPDGSRLLLDGGSRVDASFSETERRLRLRQGRARFIVARGKRPFIVEVGQVTIVATGTRFDVTRSTGNVMVTLIEGSVEVRVTGGGSAHRLRAGQLLALESGKSPVVRDVDPGAGRWADVRAFDGAPLSEVVALANRSGRPQIMLARPQLETLRVSGTYRSGDNESLARGLAAALGLQVHNRRDGSLLLDHRVDRGDPSR